MICILMLYSHKYYNISLKIFFHEYQNISIGRIRMQRSVAKNHSSIQFKINIFLGTFHMKFHSKIFFFNNCRLDSDIVEPSWLIHRASLKFFFYFFNQIQLTLEIFFSAFFSPNTNENEKQINWVNLFYMRKERRKIFFSSIHFPNELGVKFFFSRQKK